MANPADREDGTPVSGSGGGCGLPRKKPLAEAIGSLILGGFALGLAPPARSELPIPSSVFVAPGNGKVLAPVVNGNTMTIKQISDKATLDWQSFNIGKDNTVRFNQPSATAIALNNIHQADPSRILGNLSANGQIYLVNQNGFVFGKDSRVDTTSLVASTLAITQNVLKTGLSKAIVKSGDPALVGDGEFYREDAEGKVLTDAQGNPLAREISIEQGAKLTARDGGRILITAPSVVNRGDIQTPGGQTILAAATDKVYLQEADSRKTGVRGLLVEVATGGKVENLGRIAAKRGNVTLEGFAVNQNGLISATTSVRLNGSIRLLAREKGDNPVATPDGKFALAPNLTGREEEHRDGLGKHARVVLGQGSVTQVLPETASGQSAVDEQTQDPSRIEIMGKQVAVMESSRITAPSGKVAIAATANPADPAAERTADPQAYLDIRPGAKIDVAGLKNVPVPIAKNIVEVELRSYELRDAPLQKDKSGALYGKKVYVDIRGSQKGRIPIADISGAIARIERTVAERSVNGGSVALSSAGDLNIGQNASLDVSGGSTQYQPGYVKTTLVSSQGKYYEIGKADPNRRYDGVLGLVTRQDRHWGVTQTWNLPGPVNTGRYEQGYTQGADGGRIDIRANQLQLQGNLQGQTIDGPFQRESGQRAQGSALNIDLGFSLLSAQPVALLGEAGNIEAQLKQLSAGMNTVLNNPLVLMDRYLERSGFRSTSIATHGAVGVSAQADLALPFEGGLSLQGGKIEFDGHVAAPSGQVALKTRFEEGATDIGLDGKIHLAPGSRIDVAGRWTNDLIDKSAERGTPPLGPLPMDGGKASVSADGDLAFDAGSEISADAGAWLNAAGKLATGKGGAIALEALSSGQNPNVEISSRNGSNLSLGGLVHAYATDHGGTLSLASNQILIGDSFSSYRPIGQGLTPLMLSPATFNSGGFSGYSLASNLNGISLGYDATVQLRAQNLAFDDNYQQARTGTPILKLAKIQQLDDALRQPVNLSLTLKQPSNSYTTDVGIGLDSGSQILADPGARITLKTDGKISIDGRISAPAGTIEAAVNPPKALAFDPTQGIFLGASGSLEARGAVLPTPGVTGGLNESRVLPGGSVLLTANRGYIALDRGSVIDVSGASAAVNEPRPNAGEPGFRAAPTVHASDAGAIGLNAAEGVFIQGDLLGMSDRRHGAQGGSLSVSLQATLRDQPDDASLAKTFPSTPRVIEIGQANRADALGDWKFGVAVPNRLNGRAILSAQGIAAGGFDSLSLKADNEIRFVDDVGLATGNQIVLDAPAIGMAQSTGLATSNVSLNTAYLAMGSTLIRDKEKLPAATWGPGTFNASARNLELVGGLSLRGIGDTRLAASQDMRLRGINLPLTRDFKGAFLAQGNLTLAADQIYPSTLSQFEIALSGPSGNTLTVLGGGKPGPVLSAAGSVNMTAPNIDVAGVIKAPFGSIDLNATGENLVLESGAVVSVSAEQRTIPFGQTQGGIDWLYPIGNGINLLYGLGEKELPPPSGAIRLTGAKVNLARGSVVDISGGGQLWSHEFVKGSGGSVDLLDPLDPLVASGDFTYQPKYAVLPWLKDRLAPYDPIETPKSGLGVGASVYLADSAAGLPAGKYTLLPAAYALLPGAYLVTPHATAVNAMPGVVSQRMDGVPVVAGHRAVAGTGFTKFQWDGFAIQSGQDFRKLSDYKVNTANGFFANEANKLEVAMPTLPRDAGKLTLEVGNRLNLDGMVKGDPDQGGHGGRIDIAANNLRVVPDANSQSAAADEVLLQARQLANLNVESLLLGGVRSTDGKGATQIAVQSGRVVVDQGSALKMPEIMLAANDRIDVRSGTELRAQGKLGNGASAIHLGNRDGSGGDGAFLRVSGASQADIVRGQPLAQSRGTLNIEQGAVLGASGSMILDSTQASSFAGQIDMKGGSLSLGANRINLGTATGDSPGLTLTESQLASFTVDELILRSASEVRAYGQIALATKKLDIQASGLAGYANAGALASLSADEIKLSNRGSKPFSASGGEGGGLDLKAKQFDFGGGNFTLAGFKTVNLEASGQFTAAGQGSLAIAGDTRLSTPMVTAKHGADFTLDASGHAFALSGATGSGAAANPGLGAKFSLLADSIDLNGKIQLPSGSFTASAEHGLNLESGAAINVSGITQTYAGKAVYTPGGQVALSSAHGDVNLLPGATIDVSAQERAGTFSLSAPEGSATLQATLKGAAANPGGVNASLFFDLGRAADQGAGAFAYSRSVGRTQDFELRLRQGDLSVGAGTVLKSQEFHLSADTGNLNVAGTLDASGARAGAIGLAAGDKVHLGAGAQLLAGSGTANAKGGSVFIESVDRDGNGISGIVADAGSLIDVRGGPLQNPAATPNADQIRYLADGPTVTDPATGTQYLAGDIHLRALRDSRGDGGNVLGVDFRGNGQGAAAVVAEAVKVYTATDIGRDQITAWKNDTLAYMASPQAGGHPGLAVMPGLEIRSTGAIALAADWDFRTVTWVDQNGAPVEAGAGTPVPDNAWRYGANRELPGFLTLRAQGDVVIKAKLSDGIAPGQIDDGQGTLSIVPEAIQPGASWSYRVVAGADPGAADSRLNLKGVGNIEIGPDSAVRSGTGNIELHAGKDFKLDNEGSAVYTFGALANDPRGRFGSFSGFDAVWNFYAEYPTQGGNIDISAGGDIIGAQTRQFVPDWLVRTGSWQTGADNTFNTPVTWGIALSQGDQIGNNGRFNIDPELRGFKQNIGALGGGNIRIAAGGNIAELSAVIPTVGKQVGGGTYNQLEVHGGGVLDVKAGGNISGGMYYVEKGEGSLDSGGAILGGGQYVSGPLFSLGDAALAVSARSDLAIGTVFDPFMLKERFTTGDGNFFSTYSDASKVSFSSLAGNIAFNNDMAVFNKNYVYVEDNTPVLDSDLANFKGGDYPALFHYPGTVSARAYSGSIDLVHSFSMAPSPNGNLELFAGDSIRSGSTGDALVMVNMSDTNPAFLPVPLNPVATDLGDFNIRVNPIGSAEITHAATPIHATDGEPARIATLGGDIQGKDPLSFYLPKSARIESGKDVRNVNFDIQNLASGDISVISAQRDIVFDIIRDDNGNLANGQVSRDRVSGPGSLQVLAGRNIDLGSSDGIVSFGNTLNPGLPRSGASVALLAGLSDKMDLAGFLHAYLKMPADQIDALSRPQQLDLALPVLFDEIRKAGVDAAKHGKQGYGPGFKAIQALFPGDQYQGDIDLFFSRIHTVADGNIAMLAPGGMINAGLTNSALGQKTTADLGIVAQQKGAIDAMAKNDFTVNESRVFTQGGGDITIWSSDGNIDAGRGAKSALSAPPTQTTIGENDQVIVVFPPELSGSGIRTATSDPKESAGNVYLFAPRGVVDAGDAGIGGNNVVIAATAVIGASNINVSGSSIGVPTAAPPPVVPSGAASAGAAAAKSASQQLGENSPESAALKGKEKRDSLGSSLKMIQVDLLGFGECSVSDVRGGAGGCGG